MTDTRDTVYILHARAESNPNYTSWLGALAMPFQAIAGHSRDWEPPDDAAIVITHMQYRLRDVAALRRSMERGIPVLILADGILEYRNTWCNPNLAEGALFRPVMGHKMACVGRSQARLVESWGNPGKCEVIGLPRLDPVLERSEQLIPPPDTFRLLVMTARQPGFTPEQVETTYQSLRDLRDHLAETPRIGDRPVEVIWRLAGDLAGRLEVENRMTDMFGNELMEVLPQVHAVVTTPSTAALEAALLDRPVALLDYHICPHYVPSAWTISAPGHAQPVLEELAAPPVRKMEYQRTILLDSLECQTPARTRLVKLVTEMVRIGAECRVQGGPLQFPHPIIDGPASAEERSAVSVSPTGDAVAESDSSELQAARVELAHAHVDLNEQLQVIRGLERKVRIGDRQVQGLREMVRQARTRQAAHRQRGDKEARLRQRLGAGLKKVRERLTRQSQGARKRGQAIERTRVSLKRRVNLLKKRKHQNDKLKRSIGRLKKRSVQTAKHLEIQLTRIERLQKKNKVLHGELQRMRTHWLVGRAIRMSKLDRSPPPRDDAPENP